MITNKYLTKIIAVIMAVLVCVCLFAAVFSDKISNTDKSDKAVSLEYENKLFSSDKIIDVNIIMDDDKWNDMLDNALKEEYYECDVEVNGEKFKNVGIRPKGNTSLTSIANDPDTDRYSFKIEFDHYVEGQTCFGLDKLILNNNYADATNMKEALVYDMYKFIGADASLSNYAKIFLNGEYRGVYLALEAVEDSFMLRNYGTQKGELYKPDGMNMAGGSGNERGFGGGKNADKMPPRDGENGGFGAPPEIKSDGDFEGNPPGGNPPDTNGVPGGNDPENTAKSDAENVSDSNAQPKRGGPGGPGGPGGGPGSQGGGNLNYTDDDADSYSTIWDGAVTNVSKKDKNKVIKALKNISEGSDLDKYMDTDNLTKYMAVHIFSVNEDSLSGSMAHNYYLYENGGALNIIPWDYNLAWGGMHGGDASSVVNSPIDNAFSATNFFDTLLADSEYLDEYHSEMEKLSDEYVNGGKLDEFYNKTRNMIDELVKNDPTAFYTYDEYDKAAKMLYDTIKLRAESIKGQLDGGIPSTEEEQQKDSSALVDSSSIDISVMGTMNHGGPDGGFDRKNENFGKPEIAAASDSVTDSNADSMMPSDANGGKPNFGGNPPDMNGNPDNSRTNENNAAVGTNLLHLGISLIIIIACIILAILFKRKTR